MAVELPEIHARALASARRAVAGVGESQWSEISDCEDWTVRELVNHVVTGNYWAAELTGGKTIEEVGTALDGDVLGDDPVAAYDASATAADTAFRAPGAMEASCAVSYGPIPGEVYCGHRFLDVLVHGWDVAKSTAQDTTLDPELVESLFAVLEPQLDQLLASGAFGTVLEVPAGADRQTQLLALLGRRA
jgi:uncharacterized protein (TIGR03086 family)